MLNIYCILYREAYRRLQNDGKIGKLPDSAYLFSSTNLLLSSHNDEDIIDNNSILEELIQEK